MQTRIGSMVESVANLIIGFTINYCANLLIFPLFGMHISPANNLLLGLIYTCISLVRSYVLRRTFNRMKRWNDIRTADGFMLDVLSKIPNRPPGMSDDNFRNHLLKRNPQYQRELKAAREAVSKVIIPPADSDAPR